MLWIAKNGRVAASCARCGSMKKKCRFNEMPATQVNKKAGLPGKTVRTTARSATAAQGAAAHASSSGKSNVLNYLCFYFIFNAFQHKCWRRTRILTCRMRSAVQLPNPILRHPKISQTATLFMTRMKTNHGCIPPFPLHPLSPLHMSVPRPLPPCLPQLQRV